MTKKKTSTGGKTQAQIKVEGFLADVKATCPPDLFKALNQAGDMTKLSKASGISVYPIKQSARGITKLNPHYQAQLDAYLRGEPMQQKETTSPFAPPPPVVTPPWDKKIVAIKFTNATTGKKTTLKLPTLIAQLFERHHNVKNEVGRAMGYGGWNTVENNLAKNYERKLHARAYAAVNGLPLPSNGGATSESVQDAYTLGLAICLVGMSEFERLEEIAEIFGGVLVFRMTAGSTGWWAIYRISQRDKLEKFKRLASRDAKKIVCP